MREMSETGVDWIFAPVARRVVCRISKRRVSFTKLFIATCSSIVVNCSCRSIELNHRHNLSFYKTIPWRSSYGGGLESSVRTNPDELYSRYFISGLGAFNITSTALQSPLVTNMYVWVRKYNLFLAYNTKENRLNEGFTPL